MHLLLIDGFNLVRRIYEARPHDDAVLETAVVSSAAQSMVRALHEHQPTHACCVFDSHEASWRHALFPAYKANRKPTPPALLEAIPRFEQAFLELGVSSICMAHYEADDVIATLATGVSKQGGRVTILSTDKNFLQLLDKHLKVYDHFRGIDYTPGWVEAKYGIRHEQLVDYWALTGDSTNNVRGVPKIGAKTAQKLISRYGSLAALLATPPDDACGRRVSEYRQAAEDARQLGQLKTDVELGINLKQLRYNAAESA